MNYSKTVFLINKNVRAISAQYEPGAEAEIFKTLDENVKVGDIVVVPSDTRHRFTTVKVKHVDEDVDIDFDDTVQCKWIVSVVDTEAFESLLDMEKTAIAKVKSAEVRKKRADLSSALFEDNIEELKALPIAAMNGDSAEGSDPNT